MFPQLAGAARPYKFHDDGIIPSGNWIWVFGSNQGGQHAKGAAKVSKVMREFKAGELHSGSKNGPAVTSRKQAVAIALSEAGRGRHAR